MRRLAKYLAVARLAAIHAATDRGELYARVTFVGVILGVFAALWRAVAERGLPLGVDAAALVWYLAATEWVLLSVPSVYLDIERDVRRGDIAAHLQRPLSYLGGVAAEGLGSLAVRAPVVGLAAAGVALAYTGSVPPARVWPAVVLFGLVAMLVLYGVFALVGLAAFWVEDVAPLFWVTQKVLFVLGGLMLPLAVYPAWVQRVAALTPFPAVIAGPASFLLDGQGHAGWLACALGLWGLAVAMAARAMFRRAVRQLTVNGG